jgi:hypothetical protein
MTTIYTLQDPVNPDGGIIEKVPAVSATYLAYNHDSEDQRAFHAIDMAAVERVVIEGMLLSQACTLARCEYKFGLAALKCSPAERRAVTAGRRPLIRQYNVKPASANIITPWNVRDREIAETSIIEQSVRAHGVGAMIDYVLDIAARIEATG